LLDEMHSAIRPLQPTYRRSRMKPIATPFLSAVA
jgi:hypothetical protein